MSAKQSQTQASIGMAETIDGIPKPVHELRERRNELDLTQKEVVKAIDQAGHYDLAKSTIAGRISDWESGKRTPDTEDLEAYEDALDTIEERLNEETPDCSNPECDTTSDFERVPTEDGPVCQVCYYIQEVEPLEDGHGGDGS